ncbi:MAG: hypothetical protein IJV14_09860 [Lachnospiraceae bacterium]|nr:hypothetical protein [Lachnospiraceae bacterium]
MTINMEKVYAELRKRALYLNEIIRAKEESLINAPEGRLKACGGKSRAIYYVRASRSDRQGQYIPASNRELANKLAQKEYDEAVLRAAYTEKKALDAFLKSSKKPKTEEIYQTFPALKQKIIEPIRLPDEKYIQQWMDEKTDENALNVEKAELYSISGVQVRSKSEVIIANMLEKEKIPYKYEPPLFFKGFGYLHPDFTVLNVKNRKELIWEHCGMMDKPEYATSFVKKISTYEKNGYFPGEKLILTWETNEQQLDIKIVQELIRRYLA